MVSDEEQAGQSTNARLSASGTPLGGSRPGLIHRPGDGTALRGVVPAPPKVSLSPSACSPSAQAAMPSGGCFAASAANAVPSASIRCSTTASLRASATFALRWPARLATARAQRFRVEPLTGRVEDDVRRFVQRGAHRAVADLRDPPADVDLA